MAEVLVFHHAPGVTPGMRAFAEELSAAGHSVHMPDLFDGRTFRSIEAGLAYINEIGFDDMRERGVPSPDEADAVALCFSEPGGVGYVRNANFSRDLKETYADSYQ